MIGDGGKLVESGVEGDTSPGELVMAAAAVAGEVTAVELMPRGGMQPCGESTRGGAVASAFVSGMTGSGDAGGTDTVDDAALAFCRAIICSAANA